LTLVRIGVFPLYLRVTPLVAAATDELLADRSLSNAHRQTLLESKEDMYTVFAACRLEDREGCRPEGGALARPEPVLSLPALRILYQRHRTLKATPGGLAALLRGSKLVFPGGPL
jgi:hypothetical protein